MVLRGMEGQDPYAALFPSLKIERVPLLRRCENAAAKGRLIYQCKKFLRNH